MSPLKTPTIDGGKSASSSERTAGRLAPLLSAKPALALTAALLVSVLLPTTTHARALITLQVQAVETGLTGTSSPDVEISPDGLSVLMGESSGHVVLQLVAILHGINASPIDDSFTRTDGSWITSGTTGNLVGSLRTDNLVGAAGINNVNPFMGTGADSGLQGELSGAILGGVNDGILDVGGTLEAGGILTPSFAGYFTSSSNSPNGVVGQSLILGETILNLGDGIGTTTIGFYPRIGIGGLNGNRSNIIFKVDDIAYFLNGNGTRVSGGTVDADVLEFASVTIEKSLTVPEPAAFSLLLLGALGAFGHGRPRRRME